MKPGQWRAAVLLIALLGLEMIINPNVKQLIFKYWPGAFHFFTVQPGTSSGNNPTSTDVTAFNSKSGATIVTNNVTGCAQIRTSTGIRTIC